MHNNTDTRCRHHRLY